MEARKGRRGRPGGALEAMSDSAGTSQGARPGNGERSWQAWKLDEDCGERTPEMRVVGLGG